MVFSCLPFCLNDLQTSLSLCESVGLGCNWVDYSELWNWKRTSLTFTNSGNSSLCFPLQCCPSANPLFPFSFPNLHIWYYIYVLCLHQMLCIYSSIYIGLQFHSGNHLPRLHLIKPVGILCILGPLNSWFLNRLGGPAEVSPLTAFSYLWSTCTGKFKADKETLLKRM